jgi:hypothetical protein
VDALVLPPMDAGVVATPSATATVTGTTASTATATATVTGTTASTGTGTGTGTGTTGMKIKCSGDAKATRTCFAPKTVPSRGGNVPFVGPYTSWDANGCFQAGEITGSCNGIRDAIGPFVQKGQCCFEVCQGTPAPCGRPLVVEGRARVAAVVSRTDWSASPGAEVGALGALAGRAAAAWREDAALEHASIASFARLALELLSLGAPPDLVAAAHRAALDEVEHAKVCFAIAGDLSGEPGSLGPAPLALDGLVMSADLAHVAADAAAQSCVGETVAALALARAAEQCTNGALRGMLSKMAEDELGHAALGWQLVAWACARGGEPVREAVRAVLLVGDYDAPAFEDARDIDAWHHHGRITREDMLDVLAEARVLVRDATASLA